MGCPLVEGGAWLIWDKKFNAYIFEIYIRANLIYTEIISIKSNTCKLRSKSIQYIFGLEIASWQVQNSVRILSGTVPLQLQVCRVWWWTLPVHGFAGVTLAWNIQISSSLPPQWPVGGKFSKFLPNAEWTDSLWPWLLALRFSSW